VGASGLSVNSDIGIYAATQDCAIHPSEYHFPSAIYYFRYRPRRNLLLSA
jgi:hypothetical protein